MARKSASLLTKTHRRRIRNEFEDQAEAKKRRDQKRIRDRIESGMLDFHLLSEYPDRQLELALDNLTEEERKAALADAYLTIERFRELDRIDRDELIEQARARAGKRQRTGSRSINELELRTGAEIQRRAETKTENRLTIGRRVKLANGIMAIGGIAFVASAVFWTIDTLFGTSLWIGGETSIITTIFLCIFVGLSGWTLIMGVTTLQHSVLPSIQRVMTKPKSVSARFWERWIPLAIREQFSRNASTNNDSGP